MKNLLKLLIVVFIVSSCGESKKETAPLKDGIHEAVAQEVLHVKEYSYVRVLENDVEKWLAAPITTVQIGETYYYGGAMEMQNFYSKELDRTFTSISFIEKLSATPEGTARNIGGTPHPVEAVPSEGESHVPAADKKKIDVTPTEGVISIAELFKNKDAYAGKEVTLKGEVTKYNPGILNTNWFHVQDGSDFEGEYDLTATTSEEVTMGTVITFTGKVVLDKDFGAGYFYKVIIEDAKIVK